MDIDDIARQTSDEISEAIAEIVGGILRGAHADATDEMLDGLLEAVDGVEDGAQDYADGEVDTADEETTWSASEVNELLANAWTAGHTAARDALSEAIDTAKYRG